MRAACAFAFAVVTWSAAARGPAVALQPVSQQPAASAALDYEFFKTRVQPIFLTKRPGHARCVACHSSGTPMRLQPLSAGSTTWNEEESRKNFDAVRRAHQRTGPALDVRHHPIADGLEIARQVQLGDRPLLQRVHQVDQSHGER